MGPAGATAQPMSEATDPQPEDALGKVYDAGLMRRLLGYVRPYRGRTLLATGLILVSSLLQLVGPLVTAVALDLYVRPVSSHPPRGGAHARWSRRSRRSHTWSAAPLHAWEWRRPLLSRPPIRRRGSPVWRPWQRSTWSP